MPLSDHEQRLLEQMERALYAEDPKFVSSLRGTDLRSHYRRRAVQSAAGFVLGVAMLMTGVIARGPLIVVSVLGFVLMLASALFAVSSWRKVSTGAEGPRPAPGRSGAKRPAKKSVSDRFEDRWRKRREGGQ
ncbi:MAG TPA: DUF3040 domain-containing protein [Sporichthyaceae bacterium]